MSTVLLTCLIALAPLANAQAPPAPPTPTEPATSTSVPELQIAPPSSLETRVRALERTIQPADPDFSRTLLGPVASKAYDGSAIGPRFGLGADFVTARRGEVSSTDDPARAHTNTLGLWPTIAYRAHPRLIFNAQFGFENGGAERSDTVTLRKGAGIVRFAYLDWLFGQDHRAGVRFGHQLVPVGLTNTGADALTFFGVRRPELEREILPGDWHENGGLAWFDSRGVILEAGAFSSLNARGFRGQTFLSGGRSQGQNSPSTDWMGVVRANVREGGWLIGGSFAFGRTAQGNATLDSGAVQLGEAHARRRGARYELLGQVAQGRLADAGVISVLNDTVQGAKATGVTAQGAVEILGEAAGETQRQLWAFVRQSEYDLHAQVASGFVRNPGLDRRVTTVGLSYLPLARVVVKLDAQRTTPAAGATFTELSLGGAFIF